MIEVAFKSLLAGLSIWNNKLASKYKRKVEKLKRKYYEESKKERIDMATLDDIEFELRLIGDSFAAEVERSTVKNTSD